MKSKCTSALRGGRILMLSEPEDIDVSDVKHDLEKVIVACLSLNVVPNQLMRLPGSRRRLHT